MTGVSNIPQLQWQSSSGYSITRSVFGAHDLNRTLRAHDNRGRGTTKQESIELAHPRRTYEDRIRLPVPRFAEKQRFRRFSANLPRDLESGVLEDRGRGLHNLFGLEPSPSFPLSHL